MSVSIVYTTAQLIAAISGAAAGDIVKLAPGTYANVNISNRLFSADTIGGPSQVTIESEFASKPATLTTLNVRNSAGLAFSDLNFSTVGDTLSTLGAGATIPFQVGWSSNISMQNVAVSGDPNGTLANTASGMMIRSSSGISVNDCSFSDLHFGFAHLDDDHVTITNNTFANNYDDGIRGGGTSDILISGNTFSNLHKDPTDMDHPDAIQFWTTNTTASASNITIVDNTYIRGTGGAVQGIFMRDEVGDLPYYNVTIKDNNLTGTAWNGITLYHIENGTVEDNTLNWFSDYQADIDVYNSQNVNVLNNVAGNYSYTSSTNLNLSNNMKVASLGVNPGAFPSFKLATAVPEPQSWALISMAFGFLGLIIRGQRSSAAAPC